MNDRQELTAGDNSNNIQGSKVIVNQQGLSYSEVERVVMNIFKSNFYDLGEKVETIINERAEQILTKYLQRLVKENSEFLNNTEDPDLRFVIYEAQKSYARRGDKEIADLLIDVLVDRTVAQEETLVKIVYNEALGIIPKLTLKQIDVLTVLFLAHYVSVGSVFRIEQLNDIMMQFASDVPDDEFSFQHLQYSGCISISFGTANYIYGLMKEYPDLVPASSENEDQIFKENLQVIAPNLHMFSKVWEETKLCSCMLTSVGIAIALSNFKRKLGSEWGLDLNMWIKG
ncbi:MULTISPECIES: LPO_1073/Vpar_1526 family protein [unclassified Bacillus (in: firmicutes)]|uniref:LPO_1073/Vpar_1526 family protein n=1 Tax=unclassified Bacillus (in: firmicutes) TaxID=185979 RepID=UPI000E35D5F8|nr:MULTISPECIES: LPO_1073/Vpar_1526 family protein [unclassified Bacillus (in: firmicutes)]AXR16986.1 hypothetical protein DOS87_13040 [Bacillus sp. CR71]AXR22681.1 hypothetical protein DPQ26_12805 [Bacillus sp. E25]